MFDKLKNTLREIREDDKDEQNPQKKRIDISIITGEEVKNYKKILEKFKENIEAIEEIASENNVQIQAYIKDREKKAEESKQSEEEEDEVFTFAEDLNEIKDTLKDLQVNIEEIMGLQVLIKNRVKEIEQNESSANVKQLQQTLLKYQNQISNLKKSESNNKEILSTLSQQRELYAKEMKELQEKTTKIEKELGEKNNLVNNLREEKNVLLEMRNTDSSAQIPEVEALKNKIGEYDKRVTLEKIRVEQKEKEIQGLKKKMEQDRESLEKIADELKEKELKSKKIIDKYERSKTEIRKYREEKTQFIKQLNMEVAKMAEELSKEKKENSENKKRIQQQEAQIQSLRAEVSKNQNRKVELESSQTELIQVRKELHDRNVMLEKQKAEYNSLKEINDQVQHKRKQLLETLEKPVNHEIRTLEKILRALDKLYKDYIVTVFQEGNVVGFEHKITYIISNVQDIKEDLLL